METYLTLRVQLPDLIELRDVNNCAYYSFDR